MPNHHPNDIPLSSMTITNELITQGQSKAGGWSRAQLELLQVPWPPKKGWRRRVVGQPINPRVAARFLELKGQHLQPTKKP